MNPAHGPPAAPVPTGNPAHGPPAASVHGNPQPLADNTWAPLTIWGLIIQSLLLHPDLNALVTLAFLTKPTLHVTNVAYSDTAYKSVDYILHVLR